MLSYDEYTSIRRRKARDAEDLKDEEAESVVSEKENRGKKEAGMLLEMEEVQCATVVLIFADVGMTMLQTSTWFDGLGRSFRGFAAFAFFFELVGLFVVFGVDFFRHPGYVYDVVVVLMTLKCHFDNSRPPGVAALARLWRLYRLHATVVEKGRRHQDQLQARLQDEETKSLKLQIDVASLNGALDEAKSAKKRLEAMCKAYKDEIDTLNEALAIAAMDVAEAADEELYSENPKDDELPLPSTTKMQQKKTTVAFVVDPNGGYHTEPNNKT